jgi:hypothetical protein
VWKLEALCWIGRDVIEDFSDLVRMIFERVLGNGNPSGLAPCFQVTERAAYGQGVCRRDAMNIRADKL